MELQPALWLPQLPSPENIDRNAGGNFVYAMEAGIVSSTSVPESSRLRTESLPPASLARSCMPGNPWCPSRPPAVRTAWSMPFPLSRTLKRNCRWS